MTTKVTITHGRSGFPCEALTMNKGSGDAPDTLAHTTALQPDVPAEFWIHDSQYITVREAQAVAVGGGDINTGGAHTDGPGGTGTRG